MDKESSDKALEKSGTKEECGVESITSFIWTSRSLQTNSPLKKTKMMIINKPEEPLI